MATSWNNILVNDCYMERILFTRSSYKRKDTSLFLYWWNGVYSGTLMDNRPWSASLEAFVWKRITIPSTTSWTKFVNIKSYAHLLRWSKFVRCWALRKYKGPLRSNTTFIGWCWLQLLTSWSASKDVGSIAFSDTHLVLSLPCANFTNDPS